MCGCGRPRFRYRPRPVLETGTRDAVPVRPHFLDAVRSCSTTGIGGSFGVPRVPPRPPASDGVRRPGVRDAVRTGRSLPAGIGRGSTGREVKHHLAPRLVAPDGIDPTISDRRFWVTTSPFRWQLGTSRLRRGSASSNFVSSEGCLFLCDAFSAARTWSGRDRHVVARALPTPGTLLHRSTSPTRPRCRSEIQRSLVVDCLGDLG